MTYAIDTNELRHIANVVPLARNHIKVVVDAADELDRLRGDNDRLMRREFGVSESEALQSLEGYIQANNQLRDEITTLKATLERVRPLPGEWRSKAMADVPEAYAIRNLHRKYLNTDCMAGGMSDCADELEEKLENRP